MQRQHNTDLIDAITLPFDPVRALLCELEQNAPDEHLSAHWAARIVLRSAMDEIIQIVKAVESKIGRIEVVQQRSATRPFDRITNVILAPIAVKEVCHE